jgi:hypothetical protein
MPSTEQTVRTYRELAEDYGRQGQAQMRDRFLVLAADAALAAGQADEAERLRGRLLQHNPHHLLKPYSSFAEAMKSTDVQNYIGALRRNHPQEKAESLLEGLRKIGPRSPGGGEGTAKGSTPPRPTSSPENASAASKEVPQPREDIKVLRLMDEGGPGAQPSSPGTPPAGPRPVRATPSSQAPQAPRPAIVPDVFPLRREPYPVNMSRTASPDPEGRDPSPGAWVSTALFVLVLVIGIALGAYTLYRPFLPQAWF